MGTTMSIFLSFSSFWGGGGVNGWNAFVRDSLHLELRSRKALEKQSLPQLIRFQLVFFFFLKQETFDIHVTWFDWFLCREGDRALH